MDLRYLLPPFIKLHLSSFLSHPRLTLLDHQYYIVLVLKSVFSILIAIVTILFLFFSIKLSLNNTALSRAAVVLRGRNFSVLVAVSLLCSVFLSPVHFWMVYPLILCVSPWENLVFNLIKWVSISLYHTLEAIPDLTIICITQQEVEVEAEVEVEVEGHTGEVPVNLEEESVVVLIDDD